MPDSEPAVRQRLPGNKVDKIKPKEKASKQPGTTTAKQAKPPSRRWLTTAAAALIAAAGTALWLYSDQIHAVALASISQSRAFLPTGFPLSNLQATPNQAQQAAVPDVADGVSNSAANAAVPDTDLHQHPLDAAAAAPRGADMPDSTPQQPRRIVAIGDLHGDLYQAIATFKMAGLINDQLSWIAGNTIFVQTGDIVDRGPDTIQLYLLMQKLTAEAKLAGGKVIEILGNHEVMNLAGDWRFVTPEDVATFGTLKDRKKAFSRKGWLGQYLRSLKISALVDGTVFFHGGAHPIWARFGVDGMNRLTKRGLVDRKAKQIESVRLFGESGPLWYRGYALEDEKTVCQVLDKALAEMQAVRMVIGHTPQMNGQILRRCSGKVFVIDVGISRVYGGFSAALEIRGDEVAALYPNGRRDVLT